MNSIKQLSLRLKLFQCKKNQSCSCGTLDKIAKTNQIEKTNQSNERELDNLSERIKTNETVVHQKPNMVCNNALIDFVVETLYIIKSWKSPVDCKYLSLTQILIN